ncbi:MAG: DJ-1/PfpI family protein [Planctomycetota bacterium]|jgi:protease I
MKRLTILTIILAGFAVVCLGQYRSRVSPRKPVLKIIQLTEPKLTGPVSFEEALAKRRSVRQFTSQPVKFTQIGQLAWAGQGITEPQKGLRTAPSAGAVYPIELFFATPEGLFVYHPAQHSMEEILNQDVRGRLGAIANAPCDIIVAGSVRKIAAKFRTEARRYMLLEAGHVAQNIQLQAVCLGLGSVTIGGFDIRTVRKACRLPKNLEPLYIICVGYPAGQTVPAAGEEKKEARKTEGVRAKRAVLITARENFRDEELFETKRVLDAAGVETVIASSKIGPIRGMLGNIAEAGILVNQLRVDDYDTIIFVGGSGAAEYFDNPIALNIAREAAHKRKILAAICIAPTVLANAGVLKGVRVTGFLSERDKLVQAGAIYSGFPVERDGLIITSSGPLAAVPFGQAIAAALAGR